MSDPGQIFADFLHGRRHVKTDMGLSANPNALPAGTDLQAAAQNAVDAHLAGTHAAYEQQLQRVRDRTAPGDRARHVGAARAHLAAKREAARLRERELDDREEAEFVLRSRLYGSGGHVPAGLEIDRRRHAQMAAAELNDPREALAALRTARLNGDKIAAQAIFERASSLETSIFGGQPWSAVVSEYVKHNPQAGRDLAELRALPRLDSPRARLAFEAKFHVAPPDELADMTEHQIEQLAADTLAD